MDYPVIQAVMIPQEEWNAFKDLQASILDQLKTFSPGKSNPYIRKHITAIEFMEAVKIKRTKFDSLVQNNRLKIIRKGRKIYVPVGEVERYFSDKTFT